MYMYHIYMNISVNCQLWGLSTLGRVVVRLEAAHHLSRRKCVRVGGTGFVRVRWGISDVWGQYLSPDVQARLQPPLHLLVLHLRLSQPPSLESTALAEVDALA